jgi:leader peptidase (prepilin peptidase)/N-methyltransferase
MATFLFLIGALIFGIFVGSFINVLVLRHGTGKSIVRGRSICLSCGVELQAIDLVPLASFIILRARCRTCKSPISFQYPIVELLNGLLYALVVYVFSPFGSRVTSASLLLVLGLWIVSSLLLAIFVYDIHHKIIPNNLVYLLAIVSGVFLFIDLSSVSFVIPNIWQVLSAPIVALPLFLIWLLSLGHWMGLGDAKLVWSFGWILGITMGFTSVIFGFWIGAVVALLILFMQRVKNGKRSNRMTMKSEVPFAPFLIVGFFIVLFTGFNLFFFPF